MGEITAEEENKEKRMKRIEGSLRDLWDNIKSTNIRITGVFVSAPTPHKVLGPGIDGRGIPRALRATGMGTGHS